MTRDGEALLTRWILHEKKVVTSRLLSRELGCHVNEARSELGKFHEQTKKNDRGSVHATHLVIGKRDKTKAILVVSEEKLQETIDSFQTIISTDVYSLEPNRLTDYDILTTCSDDLIRDPKYIEKFKESNGGEQYGIIQCSEVKMMKRRQTGFDGQTTAKIAIDKTTNSAKPPGHGKIEPPQPQRKTNQSQVKAPQAMFARSKSSDKQSTSSEAAKPMPANGNTNFTEPVKKAPTKKRQIEDSDDEVDDRQTEEDRAALAQMMEMDDPEPEVKPEPVPSLEEKKPVVTKTVGGRRKKKVKVKRTYKNAKGYTVTEDVEEWVSASEAEDGEAKPVSEAPKTAPAPAAGAPPLRSKPQPPSAPSRKPGKQGSIMSFFGKK